MKIAIGNRCLPRTVLPATAVSFLLATISPTWAIIPGIDQIRPGTNAYPDHYSVEVSSGTPTASFHETGIRPEATFNGIRDISLDVNGGSGAFSSKLEDDDFLSFENESDTLGILTLDYGAEVDLNKDFVEGGKFNAIQIEVGKVSNGADGTEAGSGTFTLTLRSGSTVAASTASVDITSAGDYFFSYNNPAFAGLNFSDIDEVVLTLNTTTAGTDFQIDSIYRCVIPEPSTYALFAIGVVGLTLLAQRRRRTLV